MSIHSHPESARESSSEPTTDPTPQSSGPAESTAVAEPASSANESFDSHDAAATFDYSCTHRLPNTVDRENKRVG